MFLSILTPHRKIIDNTQVDEVIVPGFAGTLEMLEGHANFVTNMEPGILKWKQGQTWSSASISTGIVEVFENHVSVMADVSELSDEIDVKRAKNARELARKKLEEGGLDDADFRKYELKLKRSMSRIKMTGDE